LVSRQIEVVYEPHKFFIFKNNRYGLKLYPAFGPVEMVGARAKLYN
jgi:hypothetical protein